ncbi:hypothetical protein [Mucilaginibacter sp.]|uniref:hypothetical protein n=1 Tax=Mucilaginibacter sp. TaxID=1882438 RepID=UPI003AFF8C6C
MGKETAENLTGYIESRIKDEFERNSELLATKQDLAKLETKLTEKFLEGKADTIKWMFVFWIGQIVATFGFILLFLKK